MPLPPQSGFHETLFPLDVTLGSSGGPQRNTEIITLGSGREKRNQRWARSRRRYDAGHGVKTLDDLHEVIAFYEARRGPLYGFRFRDPMDWKSCLPLATPSAGDQALGTGDGTTTIFQLQKAYGDDDDAYLREIEKPQSGSVIIAVDDAVQVEDVAYTLDTTRGQVEFMGTHIPAVDAAVTAGFEFDVPVRFETDALTINLSAFAAGELPSIPLLEIRP